jgi:hypothetical protein
VNTKAITEELLDMALEIFTAIEQACAQLPCRAD